MRALELPDELPHGAFSVVPFGDFSHLGPSLLFRSEIFPTWDFLCCSVPRFFLHEAPTQALSAPGATSAYFFVQSLLPHFSAPSVQSLLHSSLSAFTTSSHQATHRSSDTGETRATSATAGTAVSAAGFVATKRDGTGQPRRRPLGLRGGVGSIAVAFVAASTLRNNGLWQA